MQFSRYYSYVLLAPVLTGCAATMLAGGVMENEILVTIDNGEIPMSIKSTLLSAKTLGVVSSDRSSIRAADLFETKGGYVVKIDRQAAKVGEMTGSERKETLTNLCKTRQVDVAMLGRVVKTESGSVVATAFTGRAKVSQAWVMETLKCSTNTFDSFGGVLNMNVGVYSGKGQAEMEELVGAEIGTKILAALKSGSPPSAQRVSVEVPAPVATVAQEARSSSPSPAPVARPDVQPMTSGKVMLTKEAQQRLASLGFQVGTPDGLAGKRTVEALRKFQSENQLAVSGVIDEATSAALASRTSGFVPK